MEPNTKMILDEITKLRAEIDKSFTTQDECWTARLAETEQRQAARLSALEEQQASRLSALESTASAFDKTFGAWKPEIEASVAAVQTELTKLTKSVDREPREKSSSSAGILSVWPPQSDLPTTGFAADGPTGHRVAHTNRDTGHGVVFTHNPIPIKGFRAEMGIFGGTALPSCPSSRHCAEWARIYLKYCLCSTKDGVALSLGLLSVISWGVAEVPQIITNYRQKSTEGLSIAFLMTWIVGDLFNLIGCFLEPATLPTQFYMALLYTLTTVVLTGQTIYYSHIYHCLKAKKSRLHKHQHGDASLREKLLRANDGGASRNNSQSDATVTPSSPIPVNGKFVEEEHGSSNPSTDYYYMSARSLSRSPVPIAGTWLGNNRQSHMNDQREFLSGEIAPAKPVSSAKTVLSVVPWMSLLLATSFLHFLVGNKHMDVPSGTVIPVGRRLLLFTDDLGHSSLNHGGASGIGSFLGWAMAIIYMGGRLPQIFLNMQRGHAEGLNPLMFTFALVGNSTYVGSILVNSLDWSKLRPNLPWLVDAGGCVLLDFFIILQFLYFHYRKQSQPADEQDNADKV